MRFFSKIKTFTMFFTIWKTPKTFTRGAGNFEGPHTLPRSERFFLNSKLWLSASRFSNWKHTAYVREKIRTSTRTVCRDLTHSTWNQRKGTKGKHNNHYTPFPIFFFFFFFISILIKISGGKNIWKNTKIFEQIFEGGARQVA